VVKACRAFATFETSGALPRAVLTDTPSIEGRTYSRVTVEGPPTPYPEVPGSQERSGMMIGLSNPIYFNFGPEF
jgi:hypothetical protein